MASNTVQPHQRVRSSGLGKAPDFKRDGYGEMSPPDAMQPTKTGKTPQTGYSGPNVARIPKI